MPKARRGSAAVGTRTTPAASTLRDRRAVALEHRQCLKFVTELAQGGGHQEERFKKRIKTVHVAGKPAHRCFGIAGAQRRNAEIRAEAAALLGVAAEPQSLRP